MKRLFFALLALVLFVAPTFAEVKLPAIIGSNMVLQQEMECPIWGRADPGENVTVTMNGQSKSAKADADGKWALKLASQPAGGPFTMSVKGKNEITLENVMVGEVWVCSGQSNMQWPMANVNNAKTELPKADFPNIRLITVPCVAEKEAKDDFNGSWAPCSPKNIGSFTAVGYLFGRKLHKDLNIPVGLINCSWGGSSCEAWVNPALIESHSDFAGMLERRATYENTPDHPDKRAQHQYGYLYNGMIRPILGYGIRGAIWYQGETNAGRAYQYRSLFPMMIDNWRAEWRQGDFPFYWVQLANYRQTQKDPGNSSWAELREAQSMTRSLKNTGEAVIIDIGDAGDIHPRNKQDVGNRLALLALNRTYGKEKVDCESPRCKSMTVAGNKATLTFEFAYNGLYSKGALPTGFAIAGEDKKFHWANAEITGNDTIVVSSPQVAVPVAVRYGWAENPVVTLFNSANLPMCPFRTDRWPGMTDSNK